MTTIEIAVLVGVVVIFLGIALFIAAFAIFLVTLTRTAKDHGVIPPDSRAWGGYRSAPRNRLRRLPRVPPGPAMPTKRQDPPP